MAIVKVMFRKSAARLIKYVCEHSLPGDPVDSESCPSHVDGAIEEFRAIREAHDFKGKNEAVHIVQSWGEEESKKLSPQAVNLMGRSLVENYFKGHQFLVVTHTETGKFHNHIVINTMSFETGKMIENKFKHLHELRSINDKICLSRGLSIPNKEATLRQERVPEKVRQMVRAGRESWVWDVKNKADVARSLATSYDEYSGIMDAFGVRVRVEDRNITYFYPGRSRGKRGDKFGKGYDKPGLEEQFRKNDELFATRPDIRSRLRESIADWGSQGGHALRDSSALLLGAGVHGSIREKNYSKFTKVSRREHDTVPSSDRELAHSIVPVSEIHKARGSIIEYCKKNKVELLKNEKGQHVLKGREYVLITDKTAINTKNGTHGTLIDFVAAHHNLTLIQAMARINNNPNLLLLEKHFGEVKRKYTSFYIPRQDQMDRNSASAHLAKFLRSKGADPSHAEKLLQSQRASVSKGGMIRLFADGDDGGALEFSLQNDGGWSEKSRGNFKNPFFKRSPKGNAVYLFVHPNDYMSQKGKDTFSDQKRSHGILVLMKPEHTHIDQFLAENPQVKKIQFFEPKRRSVHQSELDFFNILKGKCSKHGIEITQGTPEFGVSKNGPDLSF